MLALVANDKTGRESDMTKHVIIVIVVFGLLILVCLAYEYYFSKPVVLVSDSLGVASAPTLSSSANNIQINQDEQIGELLAKPNLSAIIIITNSTDTTARLLCGDSIHERTIIVLSPSSEHLVKLSRWSVSVQNRVPYTLIIKGGRIIFQSFGTFCAY